MLHYPVYPPLSSQVPKKSVVKDNSDYFRHNDPLTTSPRIPPTSLTTKRLQKEISSRSAYSPYSPPPSIPLSISTNLSSSPASSIVSPSPASSKLHRSPYIPSRRTLSNASASDSRPWSSITPAESRVPSTPSVVSSTLEDVFAPGDIFGEGTKLQGETIKLVSIGAAPDRPHTPEHETPVRVFEVVRRLGAGSYAVVYLVVEVLSRPSSDDAAMSVVGGLDMEGKPRTAPVQYGREYAIKCLSKVNLDEDALGAQMSEVTIHQSLRSHPNIVTLHRTLETSSFLLLLLEFVPGEDLFYFLEQARDHYEHENDSSNSADSSCSSRTPPTPSLLSSMNPSQQLSRTRLRLISSMFSQMCDAVAACHDQQVFHRDIKPENFIVTDGWNTTPDGRQERKVVVKLTDFGLSTTDVESSDMDCGSAPYMSYECRNNLAPTYRPRAADVWSLGIVLINMLYHCNPWTDTAQGACNTFALYLRDPVNFFMNRFTGMTRRVAEVLATRVFNILHDPQDDSARFTASAFGAWIKDLPDLLADQPPATKGHQRTVSVTSITHGFPISTSTPMSHRPSSRQVSGTTTVRTPAIPSRSLSRAPSLTAAYEQPEIAELSTVIDQEVEEQEDCPEDDLTPAGMTSRSTSTNKRRKRGARKGKGVSGTPGSTKYDVDDTLNTLAHASQSLARELSRTSKLSLTKPPSVRSSSTKTSSNSRKSQPYEPVSMYGFPVPLCPKESGSATQTLSSQTSSGSIRTTSAAQASLRSSSSVVPLPSTSVPTKKPSKWKLSFGKAHAASAPVTEDVSSSSQVVENTPPHMSQTASQVSTLIMGLSASPPASTSSSADDSSSWRMGRRGRAPPIQSNVKGTRPPLPSHMMPDDRSDRAGSPHGRGGRAVASSSSSVASSNWRSSMSTASSSGASSSAFTRYSNSSARSVSTAATSVSSASWRTNGKSLGGPSTSPDHSPSSYSATYSGVPKNIKIMDGVPWELFELPRGQRPEPIGEIFNSSPPAPRKQRSRKKMKDTTAGLDTISERTPSHKVPPASRRDASTSTSDLTAPVDGGGGDDSRPQKALQKQQINALGRMLSALRR
ncbi:Pkinase-domain-containing protein [Marasmius fiardii PR-910]|nr:Pkinase-domain-containing protein [Marasmius fiardii PR-910]